MTQDGYLTHDHEIRAALRLVNEGTAYFDRTLATLPDSHFLGASLLPNWTRRHVVAHVAFNAQALCRLVEWAATGVEKQMYESSEAREAQIEEGAELTTGELRSLSRESAEALDAAWRGLSDRAWNAHVSMAKGPSFRATHTIWLRTREVWLHAVDLDSGASFADFPRSLTERLLFDVVSTWRSRRAEESIPNFVLHPIDHSVPIAVGDRNGSDAITLRGTAVDLTRWATGRSTLGISAGVGAAVPTPPRWM